MFSVSTVSYAATPENLKSRIEERKSDIQKLEEEIREYQKLLEKTNVESKTLQGEIRRLETQIKKLHADIRLTENKIFATQLQIEELSQEIQAKEGAIGVQRKTLQETIQVLNERDSHSVLEVLLKNKKISDFFVDMEEIQNLEKSLQADLTSLRDVKTSLEEERHQREIRKKDLANLHEELRDRKGIEETSKSEKRVLLSSAQNKETAYQTILRDREKKRQEMLDEIQKTEDELRKLIDPAALPAARKGVLSWPVAGSTVLTQSFGNTPDSKILYNGKPHNGIDIRASVGTPVLAAETGMVVATGDTDMFPGCFSYGKWILLQHTNNLATLYAHLSVIRTSKGQEVAREDLIGYSGDTGYATGPHLHFTVYDMRTVQFRASRISGSKCAYLPYGGYLNPLAYL